MDIDLVIRWFHLVAAMVWVGGAITLGVLVPTLRASGVERPQLQAMARRFGVVAWIAMGVAVVTGMIQLIRLEPDLSGALTIKILLVGVAISIAYAHQLTARHLSPTMRGLVEASSLVIGLGIVAAAVAL